MPSDESSKMNCQLNKKLSLPVILICSLLLPVPGVNLFLLILLLHFIFLKLSLFLMLIPSLS